MLDAENDPNDVIIEFQNSRVADHAAIAVIDTLAERYIKAGKTLHLRHLKRGMSAVIEEAGRPVEVNVLEDPRYRVAGDQMAQSPVRRPV